MKRLLLLTICLVSVMGAYAQQDNYNWAFGLYGDVQLKSPDYYSTTGLQAKYDLDGHSALQAQVVGRSDFVSVGADYLFSFLDKKINSFNIFLGPGVEQNFTWERDDEGILEPNRSANFFNATGQVGVSYDFKSVRLSLFTGLKAKYIVKLSQLEPNYLMLGVRYYLW